MEKKSIFDIDFGRYGRVLTGADTAEICGYIKKYDDRQGVTYLASQQQLEELDIAAYLSREVFGEMPIQL